MKLITLPVRYDCERLDYSLDISSFLQDGVDRIQKVEATAEAMELDWLSYAQGCILFSLSKGTQGQTGHLYCSIQTLGGRFFQIEITQSIMQGRFSNIDPPNQHVPNLVQFPNIQPLSSSAGAFFFFG